MIRYLTFRTLGFAWRYLLLPALVLFVAVPVGLLLFCLIGTVPARRPDAPLYHSIH